MRRTLQILYILFAMVMVACNPHHSPPIGEGENVDINALDDEQLFQYVNEIVVREKLFLSPTFGSHSYFSSCFRHHFGIRPSDYRKNV